MAQSSDEQCSEEQKPIDAIFARKMSKKSRVILSSRSALARRTP
jgi:hypothetical protein